jgi:hypothetical protein
MQAYRVARLSACLPVGKQMFERRRTRVVRQEKLGSFRGFITRQSSSLVDWLLVLSAWLGWRAWRRTPPVA